MNGGGGARMLEADPKLSVRVLLGILQGEETQLRTVWVKQLHLELAEPQEPGIQMA